MNCRVSSILPPLKSYVIFFIYGRKYCLDELILFPLKENPWGKVLCNLSHRMGFTLLYVDNVIDFSLANKMATEKCNVSKKFISFRITFIFGSAKEDRLVMDQHLWNL